MKVYWSDRLEKFAEGLFAEWEAAPNGDPFARICVVVDDLVTRNWLQDWFLLKRKAGRRRVLANIDFKPLAEFVNDWLAAMGGTNVADRRPAEHPYSRDVMAWRIDALLKEQAKNPALKMLADYISGKTSKVVDRRRYDLSVRLAQLLDDYLSSRPELLEAWEKEAPPADAAHWQAVLYRLLAQDVPETYVRAFAKALAKETDVKNAFDHGFPKYVAIHVFDVMACPKPYLKMFRKMSGAMPVTFWNFKPVQTDPGSGFATPDAKLLGSLASGSRGLLDAERTLLGADCEWLGQDTAPTFSSLKQVSVEKHVCFSPRRELEAARDALHRFFAETSDARPSDALVLCADWSTYAPLVESVFCTNAENALPVALAGGVAADTPVTHAFGDLCDFRTNRFEVSRVFALLSVPQVREKFGIDVDALSVLRGMVQKNNIRWGYDDDDVKACLGPDAKDEAHPFTWRRGLDRFIADALLGPRTDARDMVSLGELGRLQPCGCVEDARAKAVSGLVAFVNALNEVRQYLRGSHTVEEWRERFLKIVDDFYAVDLQSMNELAGLRRAIVSTARNAAIARTCGAVQRPDDPIPGDVMCRAVQAAIGAVTRKIESFGDAVRIAPLKNAAAVPARFVWICGLNDGSFPRVDCRPAFDLIDQRPTAFDVSVRERDGFALLKAAMGARDRLAFSFIGRSIKTNEKVPASVSLLNLLDWFKASNVEVKDYDHPLQAYSPRYFIADSKLPPSYSKADREAAEALIGEKKKISDLGIKVCPFEISEQGDTVIALDELVGFYSRPNHFLATKRLGFRLSRAKYDRFCDEDRFGVVDSADFISQAMLRGTVTDADIACESEREVEEGTAENYSLAQDALRDSVSEAAITAFHAQRIDFAKNDAERARYACPNEDLAARFVAASKNDLERIAVEVEPGVKVEGMLPQPIDLVNMDGENLPSVLEYGGNVFWPSDQDAAWIRHVALNAAGRNCVTVLFAYGWKSPRTYRPIPQDKATDMLKLMAEKACEPFPVDMVKAFGKDELPDAYRQLIDSFDYCYYKGKRWNRG